MRTILSTLVTKVQKKYRNKGEIREKLHNLVFNGRICVFVHVYQNVRGLPPEASASSKGFFPSLARHSCKTCICIDHVVRHVPQ